MIFFLTHECNSVLLMNKMFRLCFLSSTCDIILWVNFRHVVFLFQVMVVLFQTRENYKRMYTQMMTMLRQHLCLNRFLVTYFIILGVLFFSMRSADTVIGFINLFDPPSALY